MKEIKIIIDDKNQSIGISMTEEVTKDDLYQVTMSLIEWLEKNE